MKKNSKKNVNIYFNIGFDFLASLIRLEHDDEIEELKDEYGIKGEKDIEKWVSTVSKSFNSSQKNKLNSYFGTDKPLVSGLFDYYYDLFQENKIIDITIFLKKLSKIDEEKLIFYLLNDLYQKDDEISIEIIRKWQNSRDLYEIIENNFDLTIAGKWNIFRLLSKPAEIKDEIHELLKYYYFTYYRDNEDWVKKYMNEYCQNNVSLITKTAFNFFDNFFSSGKNLFDTQKDIVILPVYYGEIMDIFSSERNYIIIGFNNHKFIEKAFNDKDNIEKQAHIFKALGDETRLKIFKELLKGPKYMTELGEKLNVSTPTINYHIQKFLNAGLAQIDKKGNRIYYKARKDKLKELLKIIQERFEL